MPRKSRLSLKTYSSYSDVSISALLGLKVREIWPLLTMTVVLLFTLDVRLAPSLRPTPVTGTLRVTGDVPLLIATTATEPLV